MRRFGTIGDHKKSSFKICYIKIEAIAGTGDFYSFQKSAKHRQQREQNFICIK